MSISPSDSLSTGVGSPHATITHDILDFTVQPPSPNIRHETPGPIPRHQTWDSPNLTPGHLVTIAADLFELNHLRTPLPVLISLGDTKACMVGNRAVPILLECFLVTSNDRQNGVQWTWSIQALLEVSMKKIALSKKSVQIIGQLN